MIFAYCVLSAYACQLGFQKTSGHCVMTGSLRPSISITGRRVVAMKSSQNGISKTSIADTIRLLDHMVPQKQTTTTSIKTIEPINPYLKSYAPHSRQLIERIVRRTTMLGDKMKSFKNVTLILEQQKYIKSVVRIVDPNLLICSLQLFFTCGAHLSHVDDPILQREYSLFFVDVANEINSVIAISGGGIFIAQFVIMINGTNLVIIDRTKVDVVFDNNEGENE